MAVKPTKTIFITLQWVQRIDRQPVCSVDPDPRLARPTPDVAVLMLSTVAAAGPPFFVVFVFGPFCVLPGIRARIHALLSLLLSYSVVILPFIANNGARTSPAPGSCTFHGKHEASLKQNRHFSRQQGNSSLSMTRKTPCSIPELIIICHGRVCGRASLPLFSTAVLPTHT